MLITHKGILLLCWHVTVDGRVELKIIFLNLIFMATAFVMYCRLTPLSFSIP